MSALVVPYVLGGLTSCLAIASVTLTAIIAASIEEPHARVKVLGIFALGFQAVSILALGVFSSWYLRKMQTNSFTWETWKLLALGSIGAAISLVAAAVTAAFIGWTTILTHGRPQLSIGEASRAVFIVFCSVWGASVLAETVFYSCLFWWTSQRPDSQSIDRDFGDDNIPPEMQGLPRPNTAGTTRSTISRDQATSSPPQTPSSSGGAFSSLRSSLSKSKLITRQHSFQRGSSHSSFDLPLRDQLSREEAFDTWDTSAVGPQIREAIYQSSPPSGRTAGLEPIPGSRPESPANTLDGPFLPQSPHQSFPSLPPSLPSSPVNFSRPTTRQRSPSAEDHIHPLFRSDSPTPPPTATAGTVVTAAPNAGQVISNRTLSRMRSGSHPSTSSPLVQSHESDDGEDMPPSPPPIPNFVLSAGARSSLVGYGKRKGTLSTTSEEQEEKEEREDMGNRENQLTRGANPAFI